MKIRVVQIWGFLMTVLGWIFVACTMAMEGWKISSVGGMGGSSMIKVAWHWSSLWRSCFTDSTSITNCYDFPVLWSVEGTSMHAAVFPSLLNFGESVFRKTFLSFWCGFRSHSNSTRPSDGCSLHGHAGVYTQSAGHGMHLPRRKRPVQVQEDLHRWMVSHHQW